MKSSVPRRGVQDIHTMSERINDADNPQRKYLTLAMLALEKARRSKEKASANQRAANIDLRLAEINAEQAELLAAAQAEHADSVRARRRPHGKEKAMQLKNGFKLSY
jgi:hypothetical protein